MDSVPLGPRASHPVNRSDIFEAIRRIQMDKNKINAEESKEREKEMRDAYRVFRLNESLSDNKTVVITTCCYFISCTVIVVFALYIAFHWYKFMTKAMLVATALICFWLLMIIALFIIQYTWVSTNGFNQVYLYYAYNFFCIYSTVVFGFYFFSRSCNLTKDNACPVMVCDTPDTPAVGFLMITIFAIMILLVNQSVYAPEFSISLLCWFVTFVSHVGGIFTYNRLNGISNNPLGVGIAILMIQFGCVMMIEEGHRYDRFLLSRWCNLQSNFDSIINEDSSSILASLTHDTRLAYIGTNNSMHLSTSDDNEKDDCVMSVDIADDISSVTWGDRGNATDNASVVSDFDRYCMNKDIAPP